MTKADDTLLTKVSGSVPISTLKKQYPDKTFVELTQIQENLRLKREALKAACVMAEMRKDRTPLAKMKKRAEDAETALSIIKGINRNEPKELQKRIDILQENINEKQGRLDRMGKENNKLYNDIAQLKQDLES